MAVRLALRFFLLSLAIEGLERSRFAVLDNHGGARNPVGVLGGEQMADDVERGPGVWPLVGMRPGVRKVAEQRVESGGRPAEQGNGYGKVVLHFPLISRVSDIDALARPAGKIQIGRSGLAAELPSPRPQGAGAHATQTVKECWRG